MATERQKSYALLDHFLKRYRAAYGTDPTNFNRFNLVHGFEALNKDYPGRGRELVDYYFDSYAEHTPNGFIYNYGKVAAAKEEEEIDRAERRRIRKQTIERMKSVTDSR